ncbi:MAG TPA: divergent PAP2 family protein [Candidatus Pacearchaeota archaeon]|nr:divergent PAP2 family protein [Candidatus Pacearchaeota archaeon]HPR79999.1 divergent PAP2 family protein [Candidatus Pacearchaeota archaeon]
MIQELLLNKALASAVLSWFIAQTIKAIFLTIKQKKFRFDLYSLPGGFPSSHTASVVGLSTAVGMISGFDSVAFAISIILAFFMIYDAKVIRGAAGKQAQSLNILIETYNEEEEEDLDKLRERLGHSMIEILGGIIIGILAAVIIIG